MILFYRFSSHLDFLSFGFQVILVCRLQTKFLWVWAGCVSLKVWRWSQHAAGVTRIAHVGWGSSSLPWELISPTATVDMKANSDRRISWEVFNFVLKEVGLAPLLLAPLHVLPPDVETWLGTVTAAGRRQHLSAKVTLAPPGQCTDKLVEGTSKYLSKWIRS